MDTHVAPTFDAFISYSHKDAPWVNANLLPPLEQAGLRVAIDYRDFEVGGLAQENMERLVEASRHVVLVMSPNWVESEWSGFEYWFAQAADPAGRRRKLIPVLIATTALPRRLAILNYADLRDRETYAREIAKVIRAIAPDTSAAASDAPSRLPPPATPATSPSPVSWKADLSELLVRSGRSHPASRRALCLETGVNPDDLIFGEAAPRDFAMQLVNQLDATGDYTALRALCTAIAPVFKGAFAVKLHAVQHALQQCAEA